jgi:hypothetical protein
LHIHPKRHHLALGFRDALREDVEALTGGLRAQKGAAWLNYAPEVGDRDTIELLIDESVGSAAPHRAGQTAPESIDSPDQPAVAARASLPRARVRDDEADLALILSVLRAYKEHENSTGAKSSTKVLREAIFFQWEGPRLPPGGKYSPLLPHSAAARERANSGRRGGLVFEHVLPVGILIRQLLADVPIDAASLRAVLDAAPERVIISTEEDKALTGAGMRNVAPDPHDPWSRYRAAGIDAAAFAPLTVGRTGPGPNADAHDT